MKLLTRFWDLSHVFQRSLGKIPVSRDAVRVSSPRGVNAQVGGQGKPQQYGVICPAERCQGWGSSCHPAWH